MTKLGSILKMAKQMKGSVEAAQKKLSMIVVKGKSNDNNVIITGTAKLNCIDVKITPSAMDDRDQLQESMKEAINNWTSQIENISKEQIVALSKGLDMPPELENELKELSDEERN